VKDTDRARVCVSVRLAGVEGERCVCGGWCVCGPLRVCVRKCVGVHASGVWVTASACMCLSASLSVRLKANQQQAQSTLTRSTWPESHSGGQRLSVAGRM
jgi:hypothetical protein